MADKEDEVPGDDLGPDLIFAGGEPVTDDQTPEGDRGDDLNAAQAAAVDDDEDQELSASAGEESDSEDGGEEEESEREADDEADSEEDEASDGDESEDEEEDDEEVDDERETMVSRDRFDQVNERMKLAEERLREREERERLEAESDDTPPAPEFDFDAQEEAYAEAVADGEFAKAKTIRAEIREAEKAMYEAAAQQSQQMSAAQVNMQIEFNAKVQELNSEYAVFRPGDEAYDQVLVDEVITRQQMFLDRGNSPAEALDKAAREVALLYDIESESERALAAQDDPPEPPAPKPKKKADVKKKVEQANSQPPKMESGSQGAQEDISPVHMTDAEFEALPETTKARMRGDII